MFKKKTSKPAKIEKPKKPELPKNCPNCGTPLTPYTVDMNELGIFQKVYCPKGDFGTEIQVK